MRVIVIRHPNTKCRAIVVDQKITDESISRFSASDETLKSESFRLWDSCKSIHLVDDVWVRKYEVSLDITDGFQNSEDDWKQIELSAIEKIYDFFGLDFADFKYEDVEIQERRPKFVKPYSNEFESEDMTDYLVNIRGLKNFVDNASIPHDFETHRDAWRNAICLQKKEADMKNDDANYSYWFHELEVFDKAFSDLLALGLPQSK